jgi:hypothetical protein
MRTTTENARCPLNRDGRICGVFRCAMLALLTGRLAINPEES